MTGLPKSYGKVSIILRTYNRLEYLIQCLDAIRKNTLYDNFEIILVDNNSDDGTLQRWKWCIKNCERYSRLHIKYVRLYENLGDWGGMVEGLNYVSNDSKFIVQLDSDIKPPIRWLQFMTTLLEKTEEEIVMLKRQHIIGDQRILKTTDDKILKEDGLYIDYGRVQRPVACYIMRTNLFREAAGMITKDMGKTSKAQLANFCDGKVVKIKNLPCYIMDSKEHIYSEEHKQEIPLNYYKYSRKVMKAFV